jgi:predicted RNase H-like HicB family nuclease
MDTIKFVYYKEDDFWVGWLEEYPDYRTQGQTIEELKTNL